MLHNHFNRLPPLFGFISFFFLKIQFGMLMDANQDSDRRFGCRKGHSSAMKALTNTLRDWNNAFESSPSLIFAERWPSTIVRAATACVNTSAPVQGRSGPPPATGGSKKKKEKKTEAAAVWLVLLWDAGVRHGVQITWLHRAGALSTAYHIGLKRARATSGGRGSQSRRRFASSGSRFGAWKGKKKNW